ncbi:MAG: hypothetical protein IT208_08770 [Chthonomonadales bacterium]|nr:hypothetical protein [Chthonomonadales bacterium]
MTRVLLVAAFGFCAALAAWPTPNITRYTIPMTITVLVINLTDKVPHRYSCLMMLAILLDSAAYLSWRLTVRQFYNLFLLSWVIVWSWEALVKLLARRTRAPRD